jgi:HTH-type transcriptional regulator/antitoxin HipB
MKKAQRIMNAKSFDELLDIRYGKLGTVVRDKFEENAQYFVINELLKDDEREAHKSK